MNLPIEPPLAPMEAEQVDTLPEGESWGYEPKWDGFRCLAFRDGDEVFLQSKACKPLARYFPEVAGNLRALSPQRFVLDGELVVPMGDALSFDQLLQRIHPAESRIRRLASETPALLIVFDLLLSNRGAPLLDQPFAVRREKLDAFAERYLEEDGPIRLSPHSRDLEQARAWLAGGSDGLDGTVAKRLDLPYLPGERAGMRKVKRYRSADCVVGGIRWSSTSGDQIGSLLLGLFDGTELHHVGFCSGFNRTARAEATERIRPYIGGGGFSGRAPGGPSRWATERSAEWVPLRPELVVEVGYDHFSEGRFRHGTRFLRWRPDKPARHCTFDQIETGGRSALALLRT